MSTIIHHLFFLNDTATTEIYTLSLHDALPISATPPNKEIHKTALDAEKSVDWQYFEKTEEAVKLLHSEGFQIFAVEQDRKSTRLNSSHVRISYAVFCLKKKKKKNNKKHIFMTI